MPDYSGQFSQISATLGELKATLSSLIRELSQARSVDRTRIEEVLSDLEKIQRHLEDHDSQSGRQVQAIDGATVELNSNLLKVLDGIGKLLDRRAFWQPVLQTFLKSLVPAGLGTGALALLAYIISNWVEIGAALTGWLR